MHLCDPVDSCHVVQLGPTTTGGPAVCFGLAGTLSAHSCTPSPGVINGPCPGSSGWTCSDATDFQNGLVALNNNCCGNASNCASGVPVVCPTECARVLAPFRLECGTIIAAEAPTVQSQLDAAAVACDVSSGH